MLVKGYVASSDELFDTSYTGGLKIETRNGLLPLAARLGNIRRQEQHLPRVYSNVISVRPGLTGNISFYGVWEYDGHLLIAISDGIKTRFYYTGCTPRATLLVMGGVNCLDQVFPTMIRGMLTQDGPGAVHFYAAVANMMLVYLLETGKDQTFTVEGVTTKTKKEFIASLEWERFGHRKMVTVSSTLDSEVFRKVSLLKHPIAEVHRLCSR